MKAVIGFDDSGGGEGEGRAAAGARRAGGVLR